MTKLATGSKWVGGEGYRKVWLRDDEDIIKSDVALHSGPMASWPLGKLFLTTHRLIWTPMLVYFLGLHFPVRRIIPLSTINDVDVCRLGISAIFGAFATNGWAVKSDGKTYQFCFPLGSRSKSKTEGWIAANRECAANS